MSLKQSAELNKTKLKPNEQRLMESCLESVFKMRVHLISLHYLAEYNEKAMQEFVSKHQSVFNAVCEDLNQLQSCNSSREFFLDKLCEANHFTTDAAKEIMQNMLDFDQLAYKAQSALIQFKSSCK